MLLSQALSTRRAHAPALLTVAMLLLIVGFAVAELSA